MRPVRRMKSWFEMRRGVSTTFHVTISEHGGAVNDPEYVYTE